MLDHGKIIITPADEELIKLLRETFRIGRLEAIEQVVKNKRHLIKYYIQERNERMVEQLKKELGED